MNNNIARRVLVTIVSLILSTTLFISQDVNTTLHGLLKDVQCDIDVIDPPMSLNKSQLAVAKSIVDLNPYYKRSWVKEFKRVEIITIHDGEERVALGTDDGLTPEQQENLLAVDDDTEVIVFIRYIPDNSLPNNEEHDIKYTLAINPDSDARYPGSEEELAQYLRSNLLDHLPDSTFRLYQMAAAKFTVDEAGQIIEPKMFWPTENSSVDSLMVQAICNMPQWIPAQYDSGLKVPQEYALNLGDMSSCVANLVNTRNNSLPPEKE
jgi:hypothetical protein